MCYADDHAEIIDAQMQTDVYRCRDDMQKLLKLIEANSSCRRHGLTLEEL